MMRPSGFSFTVKPCKKIPANTPELMGKVVEITRYV